MTIIFIILVLLVFMILWVVFVPVYLRINTDVGQYEISQKGTLRFSFHPRESPALRLRVFGFGINMQKKARPPSLPASEKKKGKPAVKRSPRAWLDLQRGILRSLRLRKLECAVDLDDVVLTARLVPFLMLLNRGAVSISTNYVDRNFLRVEVEGRINRILWTICRFFIKK
jgi:hypothetical protein